MPDKTEIPWKKIVEIQPRLNVAAGKYFSVAIVKDDKPVNQVFTFRGFAGQDDDGETGWESDLLATVCDKRVFNAPDNTPYELTWILSETNEQLRIRGNLHTLGAGDNLDTSIEAHMKRKKLSKILKDSDEDFGDKISLATKSFLKRIKSQLHHKKDKSATSFDWEAERLRQWHELTDSERAVFTWPAPGQPTTADDLAQHVESLEIGESDAEGWFRNEDEGKQVLLERGYENFLVIFLDVQEVDHLVFGENGHKRTLYKKTDGWTAVPLNP